MSELPLTRAAAAPSKAETLEQLRRKMASIPARSDGGEPAMSAVMLRSIAEPTPIVASAQTALRTLPVPSPIAELLPRGGLARGTVASVSGAASLLVGLLASVTAGGSHAAVIGMPDLSLLAAVEQGADLSKIALVPEPKGSAVEVAAILLDGVDLVVLGLSGAAVTPSRARAVVARARSKGAVLLVSEGRWDGVDLRLESQVAGYSGLGEGHGRVTGVQLDVAAAGKGFQRRTLRTEIRSDSGSVAWRTVPEVHATGAAPLRAAL
ncbi:MULTISPECIES: hypothetical protein [Rhodococcus]|uniref:hypothetical protein n=1 Tax=Rhodococcus TaxID=1827 RepID=UPI000718027F|nr:MULTISPECIES: hypothetical protein [Rhodococcus]MBW0288756.1 hypothetical protein [Rhodococcus sp. MH15]MCZ4618643.1 hypothetical protein [Rhodococcus qingshengii]MEA1798796.1 hypothetical protein [Rhodococcus qingshengii]